MIQIMNLRQDYPSEPYDFRVDRRTPLGNPHPLLRESDRDKVCDLYVVPVGSPYFRKILEAYKEHGRLRLYCWCTPKRCHAESIKAAVLAICN